MGKFFAVIAIDAVSRNAAFPAQIIDQDPGAGAFLAVDITHARLCQIGDPLNILRVPFLQHQPLRPADAFHQTDAAVREISLYISSVVNAVAFVQEMHACNMRFPAFYSHDAAHRSDMRRAHMQRRIRRMQQVGDLIQQRIVAADGDQCAVEFFPFFQEPYRDFAARFISFHTLGNLQDPVRFHEGGDHTAAAA